MPHFNFVPPQQVLHLPGGISELLVFIKNESLFEVPFHALVLHLQSNGGWYVFSWNEFTRGRMRFLDLDPQDQTEDAFKEVFDVHEHTTLPRVAPGEPSLKKAVVLDGDRFDGAWMLDFADVWTEAYAPRLRSILADDSTDGASISKDRPNEPIHRYPQFLRPDRTDAAPELEAAAPATEHSPDELVEPLRRTPHMAFDHEAPFAPGSQFTVEVYADTSAPNAGEVVEDIIIIDPLQQAEYVLVVTLAPSQEIEIIGSQSQTLILSRTEARTTSAFFPVRIRAETQLGVTAALTASFSYAGRPCGRVSRSVMTNDTASQNTDVRDFSGKITLDVTAQEPDLTIVVSCPDKAEDRYVVTVRTSHLVEFSLGVTASWPLGRAATQMVGDVMENFVRRGLEAEQRRDALLGAGQRLFRAAPEHFKRAWWGLIRSGKMPQSIFIVSEEPHIPWELMVPDQSPMDLPSRDWRPIGVECRVGRWVHEGHLSPPQSFRVDASYVIAPRYKGPSPAPLTKSAEERDFVTQKFAGEAIDPATYSKITGKLRNAPRPLLHFVCHGASLAGKTEQILHLEGGGTLSSNEVFGSKAFRTACTQVHPVVFLNACQVGREVPDLTGVGGFAATFIAHGASCVIAPLWSVRDGLAHEVAVELYTKVCDAEAAGQPVPPLAELLREVRARSFAEEGPQMGEDTFAAYCLYGDPFFTLLPPETASKPVVEPIL